MAIENEELMHKLVRTGMIMRHIDGDGPPPHKHGNGGPEVGDGCFGPGEEAGHGRGPHGGDGHPRDHDPGRKGQRRGQERVLSILAMKEGMNQKDLAFLLGIRPQTLGEMLAKLEERGLVERKKSPYDARAIEVTLTDEGHARAAEIAERRKLAAADLFAVLDETEKEQLSVILDKLDAELEKHRPKHGPHHAEEATSKDEPARA